MKRILLVMLMLAGSLVLALAQEEAEPALAGIEDVEFVAWVTGPESQNETDERYAVSGTDLGSMFDMNGTLYIAFGDTFACCPPAEGGAGGENWRSNVLAYTTDTELDDGIAFDGMITNEDGDARAVLTKRKSDVTIIPTYGIAIDDRLYLHYMSVAHWGAPGHWTLNRSGWAYSDDQGQTWTQPDDAIWQGNNHFGQTALVRVEDDVYVFGIPGGRFDGVALARVPAADMLDMTAYHYWNGSEWSENVADAVEIIPAPVGELSVAWNEFLGRWIITYLDEFQHGIVMREAPELTGPWSDTTVVVTSDDYPSLYGSYLHPWASDGEVIYFNMSQWGPYNVMLMRARLVKAD